MTEDLELSPEDMLDSLTRQWNGNHLPWHGRDETLAVERLTAVKRTGVYVVERKNMASQMYKHFADFLVKGSYEFDNPDHRQEATQVIAGTVTDLMNRNTVESRLGNLVLDGLIDNFKTHVPPGYCVWNNDSVSTLTKKAPISMASTIVSQYLNAGKGFWNSLKFWDKFQKEQFILNKCDVIAGQANKDEHEGKLVHERKALATENEFFRNIAHNVFHVYHTAKLPEFAGETLQVSPAIGPGESHAVKLLSAFDEQKSFGMVYFGQAVERKVQYKDGGAPFRREAGYLIDDLNKVEQQMPHICGEVSKYNLSRQHMEEYKSFFDPDDKYFSETYAYTYANDLKPKYSS